MIIYSTPPVFTAVQIRHFKRARLPPLHGTNIIVPRRQTSFPGFRLTKQKDIKISCRFRLTFPVISFGFLCESGCKFDPTCLKSKWM
ncbi:Hypothetical predicted protein [Cloeon dipterum]|uniref:Uncharacterized protein n=1 Tax=Cloeon dipterum TaxID=197152 RepID=A0A8S1CSZ4_9INSE|nr:Hypothetical predicted protein [Cloeon dipterum]